MLPNSTAVNKLNRSLRYAVLLSCLAAAHASSESRANPAHSVVSQFRAAVALAAGATPAHATFLGSVGHVVLVRPEKEVSGIHARRVVATVTDFEAGRNRTSGVHLVRQDVSSQHADLSAAIDSAVAAGLQFRAGPQPAAVGFLDLRPESLDERTRLRRHSENYNTSIATGQQVTVTSYTRTL